MSQEELPQDHKDKPHGCKQKCVDCLAAKRCCPTRDACREADGCLQVPGRSKQLEKPLIDVGGVCGCCETKSPLNGRQQCCTVCMTILAIYVLLGSIYQFACFHWATLKCGSGSPADDYYFPGGGHGKWGGPDVNLVPRRSLIVEREPMWYGMAFDVYNATLNDEISGAAQGAWYRTWGPFFSTYTYQDVANSQPTIYMRASVQSMIAGYYDDYVMRCDGKGDFFRISEGPNWMMNRLRLWVGMNQAFNLRVWSQGSIIGYAEETFHGAKSITFRNATGENHLEFANAVMLGRKFEQDEKKYTQWAVKTHYDSSIPFFATNAMSTLYAFRVWGRQQIQKKKSTPNKPSFLAEEGEVERDGTNKGELHE